MKDTNVKRVVEIMCEESSIFKEILNLSNRKTDVLVKRELEELEEITDREIELSEKLKVLETERIEKVVQIAKNLELEDKSPDITTLVKSLKDENCSTLISYKDEINNYIKELKNLNELNGKLINNSLEYVEFMMNIITSSDNSSDNNYCNQGKLSEYNAPRRMFDLKL